jgi:endo-1,3-1,4-beta-glycanase ExoK
MRMIPIASLSFWLLIIGSTASIFTISSKAQVNPTTTGHSFIDYFSGLNRGRWLISDGWSNGPQMGCTWSSANVRRARSGALLVLNNRRGRGKPFSCAELQTNELYGFGTFEIRLRSAAGSGLVTSFFTWSKAPNSETHEQISFDFVGKERGTVLLTHASAGHPNQERRVELGFDPSTVAATYAFQRTPETLRWFVDGRLVHEVKQDPNTPLPMGPAKIYLSIRNGSGDNAKAWLGDFEYVNKPFVTAVEYVAFTQLGAPCQFSSSVLCGAKRLQ